MSVPMDWRASTPLKATAREATSTSIGRPSLRWCFMRSTLAPGCALAARKASIWASRASGGHRSGRHRASNSLRV